jgi:hypothetical protein
MARAKRHYIPEQIWHWIIHGLVDVEYKSCPPTWKAVKEHIKGDDRARSRFIQNLKKELKVV